MTVSTPSVSSKPVGVALSGDHLAALLADRELAARLDASGLSFAVAGLDRVDGSAPSPGGHTVESTIAITTLSARVPHLGWLAAAAVHRDHPYNLARRIASADHLSGGRAGLVLGLCDGYTADGPAESAGREVWGGAGLTEGQPLGVPTTLDVAITIRDLWLSWPVESIVADRETRIYARAEQILHIDHRGAFRVDGPLTVPTTPQTAPVLAWYIRSQEEAEAAAGVADVLIVSASGRGLAPDSARVILDVPAGDPALLSCVSDPSLSAVLLRPEPDEQSLRAFLADEPAVPGASGSPSPANPDATLRERLGLPAPAPLASGRPAFPAPAPLTSR